MTQNVSCMQAKLLQSCLTLCNPMNCRPPDSLVHGVLQARLLEWVAVSHSRDLLDPRIKPLSHVSCIGRQVLSTSATWEAQNILAFLICSVTGLKKYILNRKKKCFCINTCTTMVQKDCQKQACNRNENKVLESTEKTLTYSDRRQRQYEV